jgi:predicted nuclease of restriction endonuclease-like (RecB) superfamily
MKKPVQRKPLAKTADIVATSTAGALDRGTRGRKRDGASFPVPPTHRGLPAGYGDLLGEIKQRIGTERLRTIMAANSAMVMLYWDIGGLILERQEREGWGTRVIDRLSEDLRETFPEMRGLSPRNLKYMRAFAAAWPNGAIVQEVLARIPWYHHIALLEGCGNTEERLWYAKQSSKHGYSHNILKLQARLHERQGKAITTFAATLPPA